MAKRKSNGGAVDSPKKQKIDGENVKSPMKSPKFSAKLNTPKSAKNNTPKPAKINTPNPPKINTPNPAKINTRNPAKINSPKPGKINTPKSAKINLPNSPGKVNGVNNNKTPNKPANQQKSPGTGKKNKKSPNNQKPGGPKKLEKFAGTSSADKKENITTTLVGTDGPANKKFKKNPKNKPKEENASAPGNTDASEVKALSKRAQWRLKKQLAIEKANSGVGQTGQSPLTKESTTDAPVAKKKPDKRAREETVNAVATENQLSNRARKRLNAKLKKQANIQAKKEMAIASGAKPKVLNANKLAKREAWQAAKKQRMIERLSKRSPESQKLQNNSPKKNKGAFNKQQPKIETADSKDEESDSKNEESDSNNEESDDEVDTAVLANNTDTLNTDEEVDAENSDDESSSEGELQIHENAITAS